MLALQTLALCFIVFTVDRNSEVFKSIQKVQ